MTPEEFKSMIFRSEGEQFDVKVAFPDIFSENKAFAGFLKDILSFSNTPRDSSSFILFGVRDSDRAIIDIGNLPDEANIQDKISGNTSPTPRFILHRLSVDGYTVAAMEFPPERRLSQPTKSYPEYSIATGQVWFRNGSSNKCAVGADLARLMNWATNGHMEVAEQASDSPTWDEFLARVHKFDSRRSYLLLSHPVDHKSKFAEVASKLGRAPWAVVFDFDQKSELGGLFGLVSSELEHTSRKIHKATLKSIINFDYRRGCLWYFANGIHGQTTTYGGSTFNAWKNLYRREMTRVSEELAKAMMPRPTTLVVIWQDDQLSKHSKTIIDELSLAMGGNLDIVIVSNNSEVATELIADEFSEVGCHLAMDVTSPCNGIESFFGRIPQPTDRIRTLPSKDGVPLTILSDKAIWLEEELEVLWLDTGNEAPEDILSSLPRFLMGGEITWFSLAASHDVNRELTTQVQRAVVEDLNGSKPNRINLFHAAGGGGSTVAKRIVFDLHKSYPAIRLRRLSEDTYQKIEYISRITRKSVLVMVDGGDLDERQLDDLFYTCQQRTLPAVILQVQRRSSRQQQRKRAYYLPANLESNEAKWFADRFSQAVPSRSNLLKKLCSAETREPLSPFFFGLTAFGREFVALVPWVGHRLQGLSEKQLALVVFLSLAHHYGQRSIPTHSFAAYLGLPQASVVENAEVFATSPAALELLLETESNETRVIHTLVAEEILIQVLAGNGERAAWKQSLSDWALRFAMFISSGSSALSEEVDELAQRVFILRDNSNLLGKEAFSSNKFSTLLEDIPTLEGRRRVLEELSEIFPEEPHFLAHLARLYALQDKDFPRAHDYAARALSLRPESSTLHHVVGMIWREQAFEELRLASPSLVETCEKAVESFTKCRALGDYEFGAISEAQLRIRVLDHLGAKHSGGVIGVIGSATTSPFVRECYSRVSELLSDIRSQEAGEHSNPYEADCRAKLNKLVENYESALTVWNTLLEPNRGVYRPPVRRNLVWTYLQRAAGIWDALSGKHIDRIHNLMEENLIEEPRDESNLKIWMRSVRHATTAPSFDAIVERLSYWQSNTDSLEACYYLAVMHTLKAIDGSEYSREQAKSNWGICKDKAPEGPRGRRSNEWFGRGEGIKRLIHYSSLGEWVKEKEFFSNPALLVRLFGRITEASLAQAGQIELECGLKVFFVPSRGDFHAMDSELKRVSFFLGFSYQGLRAWEVEASEL